MIIDKYKKRKLQINTLQDNNKLQQFYPTGGLWCGHQKQQDNNIMKCFNYSQLKK